MFARATRLLLVTACTWLVFAGGASAATYFNDDFDGAALDGSKWDTSTAVSGPRWCSVSAQNQLFSGGSWVDVSQQPCNGSTTPAPYGTVAVGGGLASFGAGVGQAFPYVASRGNPFPASGDFTVDVRARFDEVNTDGSNLAWISSNTDTTPAGSNTPGTGHIFSVHANTSYLGIVYLLDQSVVIYDLDPWAFHDYRLEYAAGAYSVYIDGTRMLGPIPSDQRATSMFFGNPVYAFWGPDTWTKFTVDSVSVDGQGGAPPPPPPPTAQQQLGSMIDYIAGLGLNGGITNALTVKLQHAIDRLDAGDTAGACSALASFTSQVNAQSGKALATADADRLLADSAKVSTAAGC
jgi:hypothetical protein